MNSLEMLNKLYKYIMIDNEQGLMYEEEVEAVNEDYNLIKQDLEAYEKLKKENAELKDQVAYLKEEFEGYQSLYEWSQSKNSILKLENQELRNKNQELDEHIKIRKQMNIDLMERLEKLIKAVDKKLTLLKERRETYWLTDSYNEYAIVNDFIIELEEVLKNEI